MWQRKSPEELNEDGQKKNRHRKNPTLPIIIAVFGALFALLGNLLDASRLGVPRCWFFVFCLVLLFVASYVGQYFFDDAVGLVSMLMCGIDGSGRERTQICNLCHDVKSADKTKVCHCGGTFEPFEHWKWVND